MCFSFENKRYHLSPKHGIFGRNNVVIIVLFSSTGAEKNTRFCTFNRQVIVCKINAET